MSNDRLREVEEIAMMLIAARDKAGKAPSVEKSGRNQRAT